MTQAAGYSYYHLTRKFSALLGESLGSYIKKRRLADGAKKLLYTKRRIIDIAVENGFNSSEAFSRAFKTAYKVCPYTYRKNRLDLFLTAKESLERDILKHRAENITVYPKIVEMPDMKAAGLRGRTTLRDNVIPALWQRFQALAHLVPHQIDNGRYFGICEAVSEGNSLLNMNRDVLFSEVAAIEVGSFEDLPEQFAAKVLKGGRYAVFTHKGTLARITDTFNYIWSTWLLSTKERLDMREDFELYDSRFRGYHDPGSEVDIYIPII